MIKTLPMPALLLLGTALAGCTPAPDAANVADETQVSNTSVAPMPGPIANASSSTPAPGAAQAIKIESSTDQLEFSYLIPPQAAVIPELRGILRGRAEQLRSDALQDQRSYAAELPDGVEARPYGVDTKWSVAAETAQLLVLLDESYLYKGGAHGNTAYSTLFWDKAAQRAVDFDALFTDPVAALATVRQPFCDALDAERRKRRGGQTIDGDSYASQCPAFDEVTVLPAQVAGGKFARIHFAVPPYVAGAYAEGSYDFDVFIPRAMIPLVAPKYRASFPG